MDQASGKISVTKNAASTPVVTHVKGVTNTGSSKKSLDVKVMHAQNIVRPQDSFKDKIDNANTPFVPKLQEKVHAMVPWTPKGTTGCSDVDSHVRSLGGLGHENARYIMIHAYNNHEISPQTYNHTDTVIRMNMKLIGLTMHLKPLRVEKKCSTSH